MSRRRAALALVALALLLHVGLTRPAWHAAAAAQEQFSHLRLEKRRLEADLQAHDRTLARGRRAVRMELPEGAPEDPVARLRRSLLESIRDQPVSGVRLAVSPARAPLLAEARLRAQGPFADIVRLSGRVVRPGAGLVLRRVMLSPARQGSVTLEVEGVSVGEGGVP